MHHLIKLATLQWDHCHHLHHYQCQECSPHSCINYLPGNKSLDHEEDVGLMQTNRHHYHHHYHHHHPSCVTYLQMKLFNQLGDARLTEISRHHHCHQSLLLLLYNPPADEAAWGAGRYGPAQDRSWPVDQSWCSAWGCGNWTLWGPCTALCGWTLTSERHPVWWLPLKKYSRHFTCLCSCMQVVDQKSVTVQQGREQTAKAHHIRTTEYGEVPYERQTSWEITFVLRQHYFFLFFVAFACKLCCISNFHVNEPLPQITLLLFRPPLLDFGGSLLPKIKPHQNWNKMRRSAVKKMEGRKKRGDHWNDNIHVPPSMCVWNAKTLHINNSYLKSECWTVPWT